MGRLSFIFKPGIAVCALAMLAGCSGSDTPAAVTPAPDADHSSKDSGGIRDEGAGGAGPMDRDGTAGRSWCGRQYEQPRRD